MKQVLIIITFFTSQVNAQIKVEDFRGEGEKNDATVINRAMAYLDSVGHGELAFDGTRTYRIKETIELPRYQTKGRRIFVLNGNGCTLLAQNDSVYIFNRIPKNQKEALNRMMATRFTINDFNFVGGGKGINLGASYGSSINRCNFRRQHEAAVDVQFGLNTHINHCNSTGGKKDNFILRTGADWGGSSNNSQSNHSVIEMSRVYAANGSNTCFKVLGSNGVVIRDCISEGNHGVDYSIYVHRKGSTTVRLFKLENLHLEHAPKKAAIYIQSTGINTLDGIFYQHAYDNFVFVQTGGRSDQVTLKNVPHYVGGTIIKQEGGNDGAAWNVEFCHKNFYKKSTWRIVKKNGEEVTKLPYYFSGQGYRYQIKKKY